MDDLDSLPEPTPGVAAWRARMADEQSRDDAPTPTPTPPSPVGPSPLVEAPPMLPSPPSPPSQPPPPSPPSLTVPLVAFTAPPLGSIAPMQSVAFPAAQSPISRSPSAPDTETGNSNAGDDDVRIVLALDYGTTFTGVAYARSIGNAIDLKDIFVVDVWPGANGPKLPSEISYSNTKKKLTQFGYDIDEDSTVLSRTKLDLPAGKNRGRELSVFTDVLHGLSKLRLQNDSAVLGQIPWHLAKSAEDVVRDYLERVAEVVYADMNARLGRPAPDRLPIDMIITHPAKWDKEALNKTYRAAYAAFTRQFTTIRDVSFVSEPEACAHYTMRAAQIADHARFRRDDCFVVVDAGGGTVDLASFQITDIDGHRLKMKEVGKISGYPCGSTVVDREFMDLLVSRLGPTDSKKIVDSGAYGDGGHSMLNKAGRQVFRDFIPIKHDFSGTLSSRVTTVGLPRYLGITPNPEKGVRKDGLEMTEEDMKRIFKEPVKMTLELISAQISKLTRDRLRVKSVFLSGGFAQSPYLFSEVSNFVGARASGISVERGKECWSAVAKGAVMKGLGLLTEKPPAIIRSPCFYGIRTRQYYSPWLHADDTYEIDASGAKWATDQIKWVVHKDDAIERGEISFYTYKLQWQVLASDLAATSAHSQRRLSTTSSNSGSNSAVGLGSFPKLPTPKPTLTREIVLVASSEEHAPTQFRKLKQDTFSVVSLVCDLTKVPQSRRIRVGASPYFKISVDVELFVGQNEISAKASSGGVQVSERRSFVFNPT